MAERVLSMHEVAGSIPASSIFSVIIPCYFVIFEYLIFRSLELGFKNEFSPSPTISVDTILTKGDGEARKHDV